MGCVYRPSGINIIDRIWYDQVFVVQVQNSRLLMHSSWVHWVHGRPTLIIRFTKSKLFLACASRNDWMMIGQRCSLDQVSCESS